MKDEVMASFNLFLLQQIIREYFRLSLNLTLSFFLFVRKHDYTLTSV